MAKNDGIKGELTDYEKELFKEVGHLRDLRDYSRRRENEYRKMVADTNDKLVKRLDELIEAREKIVELQEQLLGAEKVT